MIICRTWSLRFQMAAVRRENLFWGKCHHLWCLRMSDWLCTVVVSSSEIIQFDWVSSNFLPTLQLTKLHQLAMQHIPLPSLGQSNPTFPGTYPWLLGEGHLSPCLHPSLRCHHPNTGVTTERSVSVSFLSVRRQSQLCGFCFFFCLGVQLDEIEETLMTSIYKANHWPGKLNQALGNAEKAQFSEREIWKRTNIYNWVNIRLFFYWFWYSPQIPHAWFTFPEK